MKKLMKSILIILLLLLGLSVTTLLAAQTAPAAKDTLVVKQFSIDSPGGELRKQLSPRQGELTFRILAGATTGINSDQILQWLEDGTIKLSGIRFETYLAISLNENRLSVPFEFEQPLRGEYLETELKITGSDWIEDAATTVSLYGGSLSVVDVSLVGEGKRLAGELVSSQPLSAVDFVYNPVALTSHYGLVYHVAQETPEKKRTDGFFYRNRYWVMGAATVVASSTTAIIMSGGDSVTYLPEPPGRP